MSITAKTNARNGAKSLALALLPVVVIVILLSMPAIRSQSFFENATTGAASGNVQQYNNATQSMSQASIAGSGVYATGWFSDWRVLGTLAIMVSVLMVALAYMIGIGMESRELKVWAGIELSQVAVSALILMGAIGMIGFFDLVGNEAAAASGIKVNGQNPCNNIQIPCAMRMSQIYLDDMQAVAKNTALEFLQKNVDRAQKSSKSIGISCDSLWCIWSSGFYRPDAGMSMDMDRYTLLFDDLTKIIASLSAQRYFLDMLAYVIGPMFMLVGIILRSLWFTRKLGGLLIAIAIAVMVIYPLTYVLSWFTLKVAVYGDKAVPQSLPAGCPSECQLTPPVNATMGSVTIDCNVACDGCSNQCREIPFPSALSGTCNETACYSCPAACKITRDMPECNGAANGVGEIYKCTSCPDFCKTRLSMKSDCSACIGLQYYCRINRTDIAGTGSQAIEKPECTGAANSDIGLSADPAKADLYASCQAAGCLDQLPSLSTTNCNDYVGCKPEGGCPTYCRVNMTAAEDVDGICAGKCTECPDFCKASPPTQLTNPSCAALPTTTNSQLTDCQECPVYCRYGSNSVDLNTTYEQPYPKEPSYPDLTVNQTDPFEELCFRDDVNPLACTPAYCGNQCKNAQWPATCEVYNPSSGLPCGNCTYNCRVNISYGTGGAVLLPNDKLCVNYTTQCYSLPVTPNECRGECLNQVVLPTQSENPSCYNYNGGSPPAVPNTSLSSPYTSPATTYPLLTAATNPPAGSEALNCGYCPLDCRYDNSQIPDPRCHIPFIYQFKSDYTNVTASACDTCNGNPPGTNANSCFCDVSAVTKIGSWYLPNNAVYLRWQALPNPFATEYNPPNTATAKPANGKALVGECKMAQKDPYPGYPTCQSYTGSPPSLISLPSPPSAGSSTAANCKYCPTKCQHATLTYDPATDPDCNSLVTYEFASQFSNVNSAACDSCNAQGEESCYCNVASSTAGSEYLGSFTRNATCSAPVPAGGAPICSCRLQTGSLLTGQSASQCRQCIDNGGTNPCTCNPSSAVAGAKVPATKAQADACGYTMPTSSTPPVSSDVKDCIGYFTAPNTNQTAVLTYTIQYYQFMCKDYSYVKQPRVQTTVCSSSYGTCSDDCKDRVYCRDYYYTKQPRVTTNVCDTSYNVCPATCQKNPTDAPICKDYVGLPKDSTTCNNLDNCGITAAQRANCQQCPKVLRIKGMSSSQIDPDQYACSLSECPDACRTEAPPVDNSASSQCKPYTGGYCAECPARCRILLPDGTQPEGCEQYPGCLECPSDCKALVPSDPCESCLNCQEGCRTIPPVNTECADMCGSQDGPTNFSPSDFLSRSNSEFENVGALAFPAYVLPLFNIVILVAFVRVLSPMLGGDVEIPGLSKII
ncbi:MAG: hypothetical protein WC506_02655 [Candidatus Micrarchaeia archaeon]